MAIRTSLRSSACRSGAELENTAAVGDPLPRHSEGGAYRVGATAPSCLFFEFPRREQPAAKCLPHGHLQLLGLNFPGYVDERSRRDG